MCDKLLEIAEKNDGYLKKITDSFLNKKARKNNYKCSLTIRKKPYVGDKINIIWMNKKADNGLPHTRYPNIICLPENIKEEDIEFIILHETVHITQRLYTNEWNYILEKWNMKPWKGVLPTEINNRIRINPDTINEPLYIWKKRWIVIGLFRSNSKPNIKKIINAWWDIKKNILIYEPPEDWKIFFGDIEGEHPYEMAAYYITKLYSNSTFSSIASSILLKYIIDF